MAEFGTYGSLRHVGRWVLLALVVLPVIWVLFIASGTSFGPAIDDPKDFLITLLNGVTAAALYFVVASGFTLIFGLMRVVNMAHGAFFLLGGYIALRVQRNMVGGDAALGLSSAQVSLAKWVVPALAAVAVVAGVGLLMQQLFLRWNQGQDLRQALITIAISIILADQMLAHFGGVAQDISWPGTFDKFVNLHVAGIQYTMTRLVILGIGLVIGGALWFWLQTHAHRHGHPRRRRRPRHGLGDGDQHPAHVRHRVRRRRGARRPRRGHRRLVREPRAGVDANWLLNSLVVVIIGGMGSLGGAAIGSLLLGLTTNFAAAYLPSDYTYYSIIFTFVLLAIVLAVRPLGLFGRPA